MNTSDQQQHGIEGVLLMLAEMKGDIKLILSQVTDLMGRMTKVETITHELDKRTETLAQDARAEEAKKIALALALRESKETADASAAADVAKETAKNAQEREKWTPVQRLIGFAVAAVTIIGTLASVVLVMKPALGK